MSSELKECPFCGGEATIKHLDWFIPGQFLYGAKCSCCGAESAVKSTEGEAIAAWNTRAERTCKQILTDCNDGLMPPFVAHCSNCGDEWGYTPKYCPNCGAKVVDDGR